MEIRWGPLYSNYFSGAKGDDGDGDDGPGDGVALGGARRRGGGQRGRRCCLVFFFLRSHPHPSKVTLLNSDVFHLRLSK